MVDLPQPTQHRCQLLDPPEIGMETHLEAEGHRHARALRRRKQRTVGRFRRRRRLFQQHRPAPLHAAQRQRHVQPVRRGDDDCINRSLDYARDDRSKEVVGRREAAIGGDAEARGGLAEPEGVRFHQAAHVHAFGQTAQIFAGAVTGPDDGDVHVTSDRGRAEGRQGSALRR